MDRTLRIEPGRTVALTSCPAYDNDGNEVILSGLWELVEYEQADRSAGYSSAFWLVVAAGTDPDAPDDKWHSIDPYTLMQQADPDAWAAELASEREMEYAMEMMDTGSGKPYFGCPMARPESFDDEDRGHRYEPTGRWQAHMDRIAGPMCADELRCIACGSVRWDVG